ncbi:MAG: Calx-beta domain-containing protein, partial [Kiritimatiellia bacterium]|nr:Calx-beta domain-containing protein [Kiritimatiellia bacterium]
MPRTFYRTVIPAGCLALSLIAVSGMAAAPRDFAVDLQAAVSDTAPRITLSWTPRVQTHIASQTIHRRLKGGTSWTKLKTLTTTQTNYVDGTALAGVEYEYWMQRVFTGLTPDTAIGYLSAGVRIPEVHERGVLLLVIDDTLVAPLEPEIAQLKMDLAADGWQVQEIIAPRTNAPSHIRAMIQSAYGANPSQVKQVYLLGHVPVPYSGNTAPDGHGNHQGAWPADGYYGEMNSSWSDSSVNNTTASRTANHNIPGDGKFDTSSFPSTVELGVGRVDMQKLSRSPSGAATEEQLLRRYLRKAHDFRYKQGAYQSIPRRSLIRDGFGHFNGSEPFAATAWATALTSVGILPEASIDEAPGGTWFSSSYAGGKDYLWGFGCGGGSYEYASGLGVSTDFGRKSSRVVFNGVFGSYHGDWDSDNNLMRSILAGNATGDSLALACLWAGRPNWFMHSLGMGETLGHMTRLSMNADVAGGGKYTPGGSFFRGIHLALMGDPALRFHVVEPPRRLVAQSSNREVVLSWADSTEPDLQGYHVYRATSPFGPFARLTTAPLARPGFTNAPVTPDMTYTYLVRTLKLESVPGGTYFNLSVGSPVTLTSRESLVAAPANPTGLKQLGQASRVEASFLWEDNSDDESGFRIERRINAGDWQPLATVGANQTAWSDPGPFAAGSVYRYRVLAIGAGGDSPASGEASFDASAGFLEFPATTLKAGIPSGVVEIPVRRFGGGVGSVSVNFSTAPISAMAGIHYTATNGTLNWADGEQGEKTIRVSVANPSESQCPRQFRVSLSSPSGGAGLGVWDRIAVLLEDPSASLTAAWTQTVVGALPQSSPAVSAEGGMGDVTLGGSGFAAADTSESGRFIYRSWNGDGMLTIRVLEALPAQSAARFAVTVRASLANNAVMAATVFGTPTANYGTKRASRTS